MSILKEFRDFAVKGNVVDLAVAVIIGGAFGKIVTSLVNDVIMPPIGLILNGIDFSDLAIVLQEASVTPEGEVAAVTISYGVFIQTIVEFTIVAASVFLMVKLINNLKKNQVTEEAAPAPPEVNKQEVLLEEIRDLLKKQQPGA